MSDGAPGAGPLLLTCGEPAGIGPELAEKAWSALTAARGSTPGVDWHFALLGDPRHLPGTVPHTVIDTPAEAAAVAPRALPVLAHRFAGAAQPGRPDPANAQGVIDVIARAVDLVQSGAASGICTLPIHKQALQDGAGFAYPGHTEYLAALAGGAKVVMMLASEQLRVVPATIHVPLAQVPGLLTPKGLESVIRVTHAGLIRDFGIAEPRLAVAGLNPHAGEGGKMGTEEITLIAPLLDRLRGEGLRIAGPMSADTMFHAAARSRFDAAIAMYHDQALIPIKTLDFDCGVNVTLGLPFVRTSPDHGTAFDIAGRGEANVSSTLEALKMAARMVRARQQGGRAAKAAARV